MNGNIYKLTAGDLMTRRADTIRVSETVHNAIEAMVRLGLSALPVVDDEGQCVGVLTKTDIVRLTGHVELEAADDVRRALAAAFFDVGIEEVTNVFVEDAMTKGAQSVQENEAITAIADKMLINEVHHVPVCDAQNHVVGVVSSMDLVKAIRDMCRN